MHSGLPVIFVDWLHNASRFPFWPHTWLVCSCQRGFSFALPLTWNAIPIVASTASKQWKRAPPLRTPPWLNPPKPKPSHLSRSSFCKHGCSHFIMICLRFCHWHSYFSWLWYTPCPQSTPSWMGIYTMNYYSAMKKNEILPFGTTWMDLEGIMLSEISQAEKDKYHMILLICGI